MKYMDWIIAPLVGVFALTMAPGTAFAQVGSGPGGEYMHPWGTMMGGWGWLGMAFHLLFWILLLVALVFLIKWLAQGNRTAKQEDLKGDSSGRWMEILKERYARGEIDREEFEQKKRDLA